jgi:cytochrome c oxidase cbb3-type subunit 3
MKEDNSQDTKHVYDGIEEENNPMPLWWVVLFMGTCAFAFLYWLHYFSGSGPTAKEEYSIELANFKSQIEKNAPPLANETEESLMAFMKGENAIHEGAIIFSAKCAMCHGEKLEGKIGPNLTDAFWTTGDGSRVAVIRTITKGSAAKGMPSWEGQLKSQEIKFVASFVYSKIGSNPPNAKAPEGTEVKK